MNILGVGGWELLAILLIMLLVAGPKRMIHWSYILGQYVGKFRQMWAETVDVIQKEFDDAGVDIKVPRDLPTRDNVRKSINEQVTRQMSDVTEPVRQTMADVNAEVDQIRSVTSSTAQKANTVVTGQNGHPTQPRPASGGAAKSGSFGAWSSGSGDQDPGKDKDSGSFGAWSGSQTGED